MSEKLEIYDLDSNLTKIEDRKFFYEKIGKEFELTGKITEKVKSIRLLLMNSNGRIYLQKRSKLKTENSGMYDKTVGGHVSAGDTFDLTVVRECAEELGFPAVILETEGFKRATKVVDLNVIGVFQKVEFFDEFLSIRKKNNGTTLNQPFMTSFYVGYYDGPIKFVDGECSGVEVYSLEELEIEMKNFPDKFTEDLKFMIDNYSKYLVPIS